MHLKFSKPSRLDQKLLFLPHPPKADTSSTQAPPNLPEGEEQYRGEGALITNILRFLACLPTFSAGRN